MASGSFGSSRTFVPLANDFPSYTFLEALEEVEVTHAEAYWLGLPIPNVNDFIIDNGKALGGRYNSQFYRAAAARSYNPSYGPIQSSYSSNHLMTAYRRSILIENPSPALPLAPVVGRYYARNSTSPYSWSSTGYDNRSSSGDVGFNYANPRYLDEASTNCTGTFAGSSCRNQYALQPAIYSGIPNQHLQPANYSGFFNHQLQPAVSTLVGHGSQEFGPNVGPFPDIPFMYDSQQPNGTSLAGPLASLFEQDSCQLTTTVLCNAFQHPTTIAQGTNCPPQTANPSQGPHYLAAAASPPPFVGDANGYLSEFKDLDYFPQELMESQDSSPSVYDDANTGMDEYFDRGDYLLDDIDGFDPGDPNDLFID